MMNKTPIALLILLSASIPAGASDAACDALAQRLAPADAPLSKSLTVTLCRHVVAQAWIAPADLASIGTATDFRQALQKGSGKDLLDLGSSMFESFEAAAAAAPAASGWVTRDTEHYRLFARPGSAAANDLELLATEAERSRAGIVAAFGLANALAASESVTSTGDSPGGEALEPSRRVAIFLYSNRRDAEEGHIGRNSMGATRFSATIQGGKGRLRPSIHVAYYNLFSVAVVEHEIAHAAVMMAAFDASSIDKPLAGEKELKKAFFAGYRRLPAFLSEGVADYGLYYAGFYPGWGLLGSPESLAAALRSGGGLPPLERLLRGDAMMHAREHKAFSLASATFLRYLLQTQKAETVRDWLFLGDAAAGEFARRFGMTIAEAERGWAAWIER